MADTRDEAERLAKFTQVIDDEPSLRSLWQTDRRLASRVFMLWLKSRIVGRGEDASPADRSYEGYEDLRRSMREVVESIHERVSDLQVSGGLRSAIDADLLAPHYLEEESYLRLQLRPVYIRTFAWPRVDDVEEAPVWLTLHRSGVVIVTIATSFWDKVNADTLLSVSQSKLPNVLAVKISRPALLGSGLLGVGESTSGTWTDEEEAGTHWLTVKYEEPIGVAEIFMTYRDAIEETVGHPFGGPWYCYTSTFALTESCCSTKAEWMQRHALELTALSGRSADYALAMSEPRPLAEDLSHLRDNLFMVTGGSALRLDWTRDDQSPPGITEHLMDVSVLEHVILQYWQLVTLDGRTSQAASSANSLTAAQLELALGLDEYERAFISYGSAQVVADKLQTELRLDRLFERLTRRIETLANVVAAREQKVTQRRAIALAVLAVLATAAFALPSLEQTGTLLVKTYTGLSDGVGGRTVAQSAIYVYAGVLIALAVTGLVVLRSSGRFFSIKKRPVEFGREWPDGGVRVSMASRNPGQLSDVPAAIQEHGDPNRSRNSAEMPIESTMTRKP